MSNKKITFEDAINELEEKVKNLESGNMTLEESISSFENAVKLAGICNERLDSAERRVRLLIEGADGEVTDRDFGGLQDET
jgi:exodeoxyribonuclease VII small subunit